MNEALTATSGDVDSRFRTLVQSPLRAGLLRFLAARPGDSFDVDALMAAFGRMRLDIQNCVLELVDFGVARRISATLHATPSHAPVTLTRFASSTRSSSGARPSPLKTSRRRYSASAK